MLNPEQYEAKWNEIKGGIRTLWGQLTEDEIEARKDNLLELVDLVQDRYGETRDEIRQRLDHLMNSFDNDTDKNITPDESSFQRKPFGDQTYH